MTRALLTCILGLTLTGSALAADVVFSRDGKSVTLLPQTGTADHLWRVDLKTKAITNLPLGLPEGQTVRSLSNGAEGELLLLTGEAVYVLNAKGIKKLCDTAPLKDASDLTTAPPKSPGDMADWLIVTGADKNHPESDQRRVCYARQPGGKSFEDVFCRRVDHVGQGAFTPDGRYFFLADNALWEGHFSYWPDNGPDNWRVSLTGTSIAPLAYCDSNFTNTGEYRVGTALAVAGKNVYLTLKGRHGADLLLRVTMPAKPPSCDGTESAEALMKHYAMQSKVLSSVKVLTPGDYIEALAATVVNGEERIFYIVTQPGQKTGQMMLWTSKTPAAEVIGEFKDEQ